MPRVTEAATPPMPGRTAAPPRPPVRQRLLATALVSGPPSPSLCDGHRRRTIESLPIDLRPADSYSRRFKTRARAPRLATQSCELDDVQASRAPEVALMLRPGVARVSRAVDHTRGRRPERQCAARRLGRRRRVLWWRSRRMRSRSPSAAHFSVPGSGAVLGSWRHRGRDQVQRLRNRHQIELGPRQRGVSRA